jgi:hypothetical protein
MPLEGRKGLAMKRLLTALALVMLVSTLAVVGTASADPSKTGPPTTMTCTQGGEPIGSVYINFGDVHNRSHQAFVITGTSFANANSIFVLASSMFTVNGVVVAAFSGASGVANTVSCTTGPVIIGGDVYELEATGFFTPRS